MKRYIAKGGLASYNLGSKYESYETCSQTVKNTALKTMGELHIEMGSLDIIENDKNHYVIDVNSVSNFESQNIKEFGFNLIKDMARYIISRYENL